MWRGAVLEAIDVVLHAVTLRIDAECLHALDEQVVLVHALGAGHDLLAAHEEVVAVGEVLGILGRRHGVEGPDGEGELVHDEEVGVVFLADEPAELALVRRAEVFVVGDVFPRGAQHRHPLGEGEPQHLLAGGWQLELLDWVLAPDDVDLGGVAGSQPVEYVHEEAFEEVEHFVVVHFEGHLEVESDELGWGQCRLSRWTRGNIFPTSVMCRWVLLFSARKTGLIS